MLRYIYGIFILICVQSSCNAETDSCYTKFDDFLLKHDSVYVQNDCDTLELINYCMKYVLISKETFCLRKNLGKFKNRSELTFRDNKLNLARFHSRRMDFFILYFIYNNLFLDNSEVVYDLIYISKGENKIVGEYGSNEESVFLMDITKLYKIWLNKVNELGLEEARKQNINPFSNTEYKWELKVKEEYELPFK